MIFEKPYEHKVKWVEESIEKVETLLHEMRSDDIIISYQSVSAAKKNHIAKYHVRVSITQIKIEDQKISQMFEMLQDHKADYNIGHFEIAQSPLKDIFESLVS